MGNQFPLRIGRYGVCGELGRGGQGTVFLAHDPVLDREVALKVLNTEFLRNKTAAECFRREARATAKLHHPNIVEVFDHSSDDATRPYIVSERLNGKPLSQVVAMREGRLDVQVVAAIGHELCLALQHAHEHGVIHRDLKPDNVFWEPSGRIVLVDFGIAKDIRLYSRETSVLAGTPYYMAPEQLQRQRSTKASDLFSLGTLIYFLLTKKEAFEDESVFATMQRIVHGAPHPIAMHRSDLPEGLVQLLEHLMARQPADRPGVEQVADRFLALVGGDPRRVLRDALMNLQAETGSWTKHEGRRLGSSAQHEAMGEVTQVITLPMKRRPKRSRSLIAAAACCVTIAIGLLWLA